MQKSPIKARRDQKLSPEKKSNYFDVMLFEQETVEKEIDADLTSRMSASVCDTMRTKERRSRKNRSKSNNITKKPVIAPTPVEDSASKF